MQKSIISDKEISDYLRQYVDAHNLLPYVKLGTEVLKITPTDVDNRYFRLLDRFNFLTIGISRT